MHPRLDATLHRAVSPLAARTFTYLLGVGACGRVSFDAPEITSDGSVPFDCTPIGHDEDGDGIDDACDLCPHIAETDPFDGDGDRVGDACDPEPANPRQRIEFFESFATALAAPWAIRFGPVTVTNDELVLDAIGMARSIYRPYTQADDWIVMSATTGSAGTGNYLLSIITSPNTGNTGFFCEMFYDSTLTQALTMFTYTLNGSMFLHDGLMGWSQPLAGGGGTFEYLLTGPNARCRSAWRGDVIEVEGTWPTSIVPERLTLYAENVEARIQWVVMIRTL